MRRIVVGLVVAAAVAVTSCANPPDKEIQQAQSAIDAARAAGADRYATQEFAAAEDALKRAHAAVAERDYRLALNNALDSRERAELATKQAADGKAAARVEADRALTAAADALTAARASLKSAEASRAAAKSLSALRLTIADGDRRLQEARAAFGRGDFADALSAASAITKTLTAASGDQDGAAANPSRRRR
jgi:hypothetical protein